MRRLAAFMCILSTSLLLSGLLSLVLSVALPTTASAKELVNRLGIGVRSDTSVPGGLPSLTVSYFPQSDLALTSSLGIDTEKDNSRFSFTGGVRRIVFKENNMNFFMGGELGLVNREVAGDKQSGFSLSGLFGGEFFFAGLENLGFSFQGGVGVVSLKDVRFRTVAEAPFQAAVNFYF